MQDNKYRTRASATQTENPLQLKRLLNLHLPLPDFASLCATTGASSAPPLCIQAQAAHSHSLDSAGERASERSAFFRQPLVSSGPCSCDASARLCRLLGRLRASHCSPPLSRAPSRWPSTVASAVSEAQQEAAWSLQLESSRVQRGDCTAKTSPRSGV